MARKVLKIEILNFFFLPSLLYELVSAVPVLDELRVLSVVQTNVQVFKHTWEEVIDLPRNVEDVTNTEKNSTSRLKNNILKVNKNILRMNKNIEEHLKNE